MLSNAPMCSGAPELSSRRLPGGSAESRAIAGFSKLNTHALQSAGRTIKRVMVRISGERGDSSLPQQACDGLHEVRMAQRPKTSDSK